MKQAKRLLLALVLCLTLSACKPVKTKVAYTVYPVGFILERLMGDSSQIESIQENTIVQRATIREDYESVLQDAAVFFYIGLLEPYRPVYQSEINALCSNQVDLSAMNAVYDFERYTPIYANDEISFVSSRYYNNPIMDTIDTDTKDLYLWTDPIAMLSMAKDIRDSLSTAYPDQQSKIQENFTRLETDLINLDAQYQSLSSANQKENKEIKFVSMTAGFGNWQKTYGFQVYPIILSKYGVLPNEEQLSVIESRIQDDNVQYIVYEPNMTSDMIALFNQVEDDLGLVRVELSNLSSITQDDDDAGKDYLSLMYENLSVLETMRVDRNPTQEIDFEEQFEPQEEDDEES